MARRSGGRSGGMSAARRPSPVARRPPPPPPKAVQPAPPAASAVAPPMAAAPGGGFLSNVASTAAGVAAGHVISSAIMGRHGGGESVAQPQDQGLQTSPAQQSYYQQPNPSSDPCKFEMEQFLACAQNQAGDLNLCDGFNRVLSECKTRYGGYQQQ